MKEIKAYIRPERADTVISHLEAIGIKGMTVIDVSLLGSWADKKAEEEICPADPFEAWKEALPKWVHLPFIWKYQIP